MTPEHNPADEDPHGECRHEIELLRARVIEPYSGDVPLCGPDAPNADQIDDLIRLLVTIRHRFGNTAVEYKQISWGSNALWASSEKEKQLEAWTARLDELKRRRDEAAKTFEPIRVVLFDEAIEILEPTEQS